MSLTESLAKPRPADTYVPIYNLATLGAGGLIVTFFMMLMFWVPHPGRPVPVFGDITAAFASGGLAMKLAIAVAITGIAGFAALMVKSLIWNLRSMAAFRRSERFAAFAKSPGEATMLAEPLAWAMVVNGGFIIGLVFVPGLWSVVEYLFPLALIAFAGIGLVALRRIGAYLGRVLTEPGALRAEDNTSFAQVLPAFALAMVGVGMSAPAAMSGNPAVIGTAFVLSSFMAVAALLYTVLAVAAAVPAMLTHGAAREAAPTLMILVPLMTVLGILFLRQGHGVDVVSGAHADKAENLVFLTRLLGVQLAFLALGTVVLRRQGYFRDFVFGRATSPGSYALVCPGVALNVMLHFWINKGLVASGLLVKFSPAYWSLTALAIAAQLAMIALVWRLTRQHFSAPAGLPATA